jgi:hypothetical protein
VHSIACARHPHHAFEFCRTAQTRDQYAALLRSFQDAPLGNAEMQRQALIFFYMHNVFGTPNQLSLRHEFAKLWKLCNGDSVRQSELAEALKEFIELPAFEQFVLSIAEPVTASKPPVS